MSNSQCHLCPIRNIWTRHYVGQWSSGQGSVSYNYAHEKLIYICSFKCVSLQSKCSTRVHDDKGHIEGPSITRRVADTPLR